MQNGQEEDSHPLFTDEIRYHPPVSPAGKTTDYAPSLPMASTGQPSMASLH